LPLGWKYILSRSKLVVRPPWNAMFVFQFLWAKSHIAALWMVHEQLAPRFPGLEAIQDVNEKLRRFVGRAENAEKG
jgi:hypothetical protein